MCVCAWKCILLHAHSSIHECNNAQIYYTKNLEWNKKINAGHIHTNCHKSMTSGREFEEQSCITWNMATVGRSKHTVQHSMPFSRSSKHEKSTGPPSLAFFGDGSSVSTSSSGISPGVTVALVELAVDKPSSAISRLIYFAIYTRLARWCRNWIGPSN